jgi:myo-inositol-1(or 4)-monophosphatase
MLTYFRQMYQQVAEYLRTQGRFATEVVQVNAKGDQTKAFDYKAEELVLDYFDTHLPFAVNVLTEERGAVSLGSGAPEYTLIIDPVDGSDNFIRGLGMTSFSVAAIPADAALTIENVQFGLIGQIYLQKIYTSERGKGAFCNNEPLCASQTTDLDQSLFAAYFLGKQPQHLERMSPFLRKLGNLRCFGSAAYEVAQVAAGGLEGFIDLRGQLTPENFMAAALMVQEAGGVITDERGDAPIPIPRLDHGYNLIVSANPALHETLLSHLAV